MIRLKDFIRVKKRMELKEKERKKFEREEIDHKFFLSEQQALVEKNFKELFNDDIKMAKKTNIKEIRKESSRDKEVIHFGNDKNMENQDEDDNNYSNNHNID